STSDTSTDANEPPAFGVTGDLTTLQVDVHRVARQTIDQPDGFAVDITTGANEATTFEGPPATSGISTVRYSLAPTGGLVRQEIANAVALREEELGSTAAWDTAYVVIAEEVAAIEFRYSDGLDMLEAWDLVDRDGQNPLAVELVVTLREPSSRGNASLDTAQTMLRAYRLTVALPAIGVGLADSEDVSTDVTGGTTGDFSSG
ncbi:MAG: hypothetical protein AAGG46_13235, partial [Planctomycetota bacterium]